MNMIKNKIGSRVNFFLHLPKILRVGDRCIGTSVTSTLISNNTAWKGIKTPTLSLSFADRREWKSWRQVEATNIFIRFRSVEAYGS